jgi:phosphodiester glycosidase
VPALAPRSSYLPSLRLAVLALSLAFTVCGCRAPENPAASGEVVTRGIMVRSLRQGLAPVRVIDVDLSAPGVRVEIAAEEVAVRQGQITGRARTLADWLRVTGAAAGINGGFFGQTVGEYKEIVGLLKVAGKVRAAAPVYRSQSTGGRYARCALGFTKGGRPDIAWVTSRPGAPQSLRRHDSPAVSGAGTPWEVYQAVACGPRLIRNGKIQVSDRGERLASPGALPRTFIGYGGLSGGKGRLVLCAATGLEFADCARFLMDYFQSRHGIPCWDAMCLDGGGSTQAGWSETGSILVDPNFGATVPTAILVHQDR